MNRFAEGASQTNDQTYYNIQSPDYIFDDTNAIDTKQLFPSRFRSFRTLTSRINNDFDAETDPNESAWHEEKLQKQQALNGHKSHFLRQWGQQVNEKSVPAQQQQQQQQPLQKQPLKSFDNNGDFMQSFDLN